MKTKLLIPLLILFLISGFCVSQKTKRIDPTGTYKLNPELDLEAEEIRSYFGKIQVSPITKDRIVMSFYICKGAPSYNSGSFLDTLFYKNNTAIYLSPEIDPSCKVIFNFNVESVYVKEKTDDYNMGCGFGHAVIAEGNFIKVSSKKPKIVDPLTQEEMK